MSNVIIGDETIEDAFYNGFVEGKVNIKIDMYIDTVNNDLIGFNLLPVHSIAKQGYSEIGSGEASDGFIEAIENIRECSRMTWFYFTHPDDWDYDPWYLYWFGDQ